MSLNQPKMPFWKTGFSQMQATATALTACSCVKFNDTGYRGHQTI